LREDRRDASTGKFHGLDMAWCAEADAVAEAKAWLQSQRGESISRRR
jgi:hypothetical protein